MYCHYCGTQIPDGARFCINCGASQESAPVPPTEQTYTEKEHVVDEVSSKKKGRFGRAFIWGILLLLIVGAVYVLYSPAWRELYIIDTLSVSTSNPFIDISNDEELLNDTFGKAYLVKNQEDVYTIVSFKTDTMFIVDELIENMEEMGDASFSTNGSYARIVFDASEYSENVKITFRSVSLGERLQFLKLMYLVTRS